MNYLLDVNVLVAWGWADHVDHERAARWIDAAKRRKTTTLLTAPIPQLGFVRVSVQRTANRVTVQEASATLDGMLRSLGASHIFLADDQPVAGFPDWCLHPSRTTDAHLLDLAEAHGASLATLDTSIPGAFVIPSRVASPERRPKPKATT